MSAETNYAKRMKLRNNPKGWKCGLMFENEVTKANRRKENDFMAVRINDKAKTRARNAFIDIDSVIIMATMVFIILLSYWLYFNPAFFPNLGG